MLSVQQVSFAHFRLDLANEQLWRGNQPIPLRRQTFAVLRYLVEHAGQVVSKAVLLDALWPGVYVTDMAPMICIRELRKTLSDDARVPQFIETVHRRGYRFLPAVTTQPVPSSKFQAPSSKTQDSGLRVRPRSLGGITQFSDHQANGGQVDKRQGIPQAILKILGQAPTPIQPRQRPFHNPAFGKHDKALGLRTPGDDLDGQLGPYFDQCLLKLRPLISPVRKQLC